jgi:subtilisin family serine protease
VSKRKGLILGCLMSLAVAPAIASEGPLPNGRAATTGRVVAARQLIEAGRADSLLVFVHADDAAKAAAAVERAGLVPVATFGRVGTVVAAGTPAQVRKVTEDPDVAYVEADQPLEYDLTTAVKATRADVARDQRTDVSDNPLDGRGITIAVNDSGIDATHPMFTPLGGESRVVRNLKLNHACYTLDCEGPVGDTPDQWWYDGGPDTDTTGAGGHGTHVAGIAAGGDYRTRAGTGAPIHGVASGASLVGLSHGAGLYLYGLATSLNWVLEHHEAPCGENVPAVKCPPIKVVTSSISAPKGDYNPNDFVARLQDALVAEGVTVVWSAGNFGPSSVYRWKQSPTPGVISVANYDDRGDGRRNGVMNDSSSTGRPGEPATYPDIAAPGTSITSSCKVTLPICALGPTLDGPEFAVLTGTSMAAPHVAGAVAQLLQADPSLTPAQIEDLLEDSAHKFGGGFEPDLPSRNDDDTTSPDKGHGLLDVAAAVDMARGAPDPGGDEGPPPCPPEGCPPPAPVHCAPGAPAATDPAGDEALFGGFGSGTDPALDLRQLDLSLDGSALTARLRVTDLAPRAVGQTPGRFTVSFSREGEWFELVADLSGSEAQLSLSTGSGTVPVGGGVDFTSDTVTWVIDGATLGSVGSTPFSSGEVIEYIGAVSARRLPFVTPPADLMYGECDKKL